MSLGRGRWRGRERNRQDGLDDGHRIGTLADESVGSGVHGQLLVIAGPAQDEHADVGPGAVHGTHQCEAHLELGQPGIDDHDVRVVPSKGGHGLGRLAGGADHLNAVDQGDEPGEAVPDSMICVDDEDPAVVVRAALGEE